MLIMLASHISAKVRGLIAAYPGRIGHLYSPGDAKGPFEGIPYALDNGRFACWARRLAWDEAAWLRHLDWAARSAFPPLWALVPDVVADHCGTLQSWGKYLGAVIDRGLRPAFAVQDGMTPQDVPAEAAVVFVGGTTKFKLRTLPLWSRFRRVHVGRVNTYARLVEINRFGVESCDGTGWLRGCQRQWRGLLAFLSGQHERQMELAL